mmetsp:Transcript_75921/g.216538  ORF Transcript_75921/g.216538 Transcript_75921/m.216538 type:complete len:229 (-) Transcript_75921:267-953(-)
MFKKPTEKEAWHYWRWRMLRALVEPAEDYRLLQRLVDYFGPSNVFVVTSNCDMLHERAGTPAENVLEIHGSLGRVQCSELCCGTLFPVDEAFLQRLRDEPDWVPRCPMCNDACLRPNVMIFNDHTLEDGDGSALHAQRCRRNEFVRGASSTRSCAVLEIGAGVVVSSIRTEAEALGTKGRGLVRINPSEAECDKMEILASKQALRGRYFPVAKRSAEALAGIVEELGA